MDTRGYCQDRLKSGGTVPPSHHGHDLDRWPLRDAFMLRARADAVPLARAHLRQLLSCWGWAELSPDAGVVVSELVTNAVAASAGLRAAAPVLVWLGSDAPGLRYGWTYGRTPKVAAGWRWWKLSATGGDGTRPLSRD
jgi:hypothetical protein